MFWKFLLVISENFNKSASPGARRIKKARKVLSIGLRGRKYTAASQIGRRNMKNGFFFTPRNVILSSID